MSWISKARLWLAFKTFSQESLKETLQSIKTFVAFTSIKNEDLPSWQPDLPGLTTSSNETKGKAVPLLFQPGDVDPPGPLRLPPLRGNQEAWSVQGYIRSKKLAWFRQPVRSRIEKKLSLSLLEGEKRYLNQALFRPIRQQLRTRGQSIKP